MVEQKTKTEEKGMVGAAAQPPAPRQFGKDRLAEPEPIRQQKKIVVMRHGEDYWNLETRQYHLSREGVQQIEHAAEELMGVVAGKRAVIITSKALAEAKSAELLGEKLGIGEIKRDSRLSRGYDTSESGRIDRFSEWIEDLPDVGADVAIIVMCQSEASALLYKLDFEADLRKAILSGMPESELFFYMNIVRRAPERPELEHGRFVVRDVTDLVADLVGDA